MELNVKELDPDSFDDLLYICPIKHLTDPYVRQGIMFKRGWFNFIYENYGSPIRICYVDDKPASQILYFPEYIIPYIENPRDGVLRINCIYNPYPEYQRLGCGRRLINSIIEDIREGIGLFKGFKECRFISAYPFDTGEYFPMSRFYSKMGFKTLDNIEYYYEFVKGSYYKLERPGYELQSEDFDKVVMFYEPWCEYSYRFVYLMKEKIKKLAAEFGVSIDFKIYDAWLYPKEYLKRGWNMLIIKSHVIKSFYGTREFEEELKSIIKSEKEG